MKPRGLWGPGSPSQYKKSMGITRNSSEKQRISKRDVTKPYVVDVDVFDGHLPPGEGKEENAVASGQFEKWYIKNGVKRIPVREGRIRGTLFLPEGDGPFPGILEFGGATGRLLELKCSLLASRGFAAMSLAYVDYDDLPKSIKDVDYEYFEEAAEWMGSHPDVSPQGLGAMSLCAGTQAMFMLGIHKPDLIKAMVGVSPWHCFFMYPFLCKGEVIPNAELNFGLARKNKHGHVSFKESYLYNSPSVQNGSRSIIPVEKIQCPVMFIYGKDDQLLPTEYMVNQMIQRMKDHGKESLCVSLGYPGAGHIIEPPYAPLCDVSFHKTPIKATYAWGGQPKPHAIAQENSWFSILNFFREHLGWNEAADSRDISKQAM